MSEEGTVAPPRVPAPKRPAPVRRKRAPRATNEETAATNEPAPPVAPDGDAQAEQAEVAFDSFIPVEVVDVIVTLPNPNPLLLLKTTDAPERTIAIPIGANEGISIANALRDVSTPKPLTHELFAETLTVLGASIAVARITAVEGGAFYAEIVVSGAEHGQQAIACRPSDAVAMALRQRPPAPIVTSSAVLEAVGEESAADR